MFKVLFKIRLVALFKTMFSGGNKQKKKRSKGFYVLIAVFVLYIVASIALSFGSMFSQLAASFHDMKLDYLYFAVVGVISFLLSFIGSVFASKSQIFEAKDNELLLSMPIKPPIILAARVSTLLMFEYFYAVLVLVPAYFTYIFVCGVTLSQVVIMLISILILPLLSLFFALLFGWVLALFSSKIGASRKNIASTIFMLAFFLVYFYAVSNFQNFITNLVANGTQVAEIVRNYLPPLYIYGLALANGSFIKLLLFIVMCAVPVVIIYLLISRSFLRLITSNKGEKKKVYVRRELKVSNPVLALVKKELSYFFSMPNYILNCSLGAIMQIIMVVTIVFNKQLLLETFAGTGSPRNFIPALISFAAILCLSLTNTACVSISLEGDNLWILQSMPIAAKTVLLSKAMTNLVVSVPTMLIAITVGAIAFDAGLLTYVLMLDLCLAAAVFFALFGIFANLCFPKFDWVNETVVIKQSASSLLGTMGGMALAMAAAAPYAIILLTEHAISPLLYISISAMVFIAASALLYNYISKQKLPTP